MKTETAPMGTNAETQRAQSADRCFGLRREVKRHAAFGNHARTRKAVSLLRSATAVQTFALLLRLTRHGVATAVCVFALMPTGLSAATNDLSGLLQKGLFEEEANRNLDAAAQAYQTVSAQFDKDRQLAATAIFRLGEIYRKQNKTNEAAAQYERIVREFPDQDTLVTLSRQNIVGLGRAVQTPAVVAISTATVDNLQSQYALLKAQLEQARKETNVLTIAKLLDDADLRETIQNERAVIRTPEMQQNVFDAATARALNYAEKRLNVLQSAIAQARSVQPPTRADQEVSRTDDEEKEIRRIQEMIKNSPDLINAPRGEEGTPLFQAAMKGQLQVAGFLLDHGAKVNAPAGSHGKIWDSWTPLIAAANGGHKAMVESLLDHGADIDATDQDGVTALFRAAKNGFIGVAESLLAHKANVNLGGRDESSPIRRESSPLHLAAGAGRSAMMELLLGNGANINATNSRGETPLMQASWSGRLEAVKILLTAKADVNLQSTAGRTALSYAADGYLDVVKALLEAKADPNTGTLDLPLAEAAQSGQAEIAELLLRSGAKPDLASKTSQLVDKEGWPQSPRPVNFAGTDLFGPYTPLQIAVSKSDTAMVKLLLKYKADANAKVPWSYPPNPPAPWVSYALGNPEILQAFLEAGADANADNAKGWPLLVIACLESNARAVELLLAHGAKTDAQSPDGRTPLSYAAEKNCVQCVQLLLEAKADANATAPNGATALYWAVNNGSKDMAEALIAHGANVNLQDQAGETPLHLAVLIGGNEIGAEKMAELLLSKGADPNIRNNAGLTPLDLAKGKDRPPGLGRPAVALPPPGTRVRPQPSETDIAALLREHGALDDLPDFNSLRVTRAGFAQPVVVFVKDTNSVNRFTLLEVILNFYGNPFFGSRDMPFPDFSKVIIHRPVAGKPGAKQEISVNLLTEANSFDCAKDTRLEFGDVVEIPEREHTLGEQVVGMTANQLEQLRHCLEGKVTFVVRGQKAELKLDGWAQTGWLQSALTSVQSLLRSSSDLSHIRISRTDPSTGKTSEIIADSKASQQNNVWLRDGDVIEVPDKP